MRENIILGILAPVDAGKTTLSEDLLYLGGSIRSIGRVDKGDTFLDHNSMEREHGITIFSKQAQFASPGLEDRTYTLLDTPGHADFSSEMERTLQVLDYAVLVISGKDGVTGQVRVLWKLLQHYQIPAFIFINKMDQQGTDRDAILEQVRSELSKHCVDFGIDLQDPDQQEELAVCDDTLLEAYFEGNEVGPEDVMRLILERRLFPLYFGSALKMKRNPGDPADGGDEGVIRLLKGLDLYARMPAYGDAFGARVYKISRDETGSRLTWMKITGGSLKSRTLLTLSRNGETGEEKADQIRSYSGEKFQPLAEAFAGQVCTVTGLTMTYAGQTIGAAGPRRAAGGQEETGAAGADGLLQPVLSSRILLEPGMDQYLAYRNLLQIEEEEPMLHITYDETKKEITAQMMGEMQRDVIRRIAYDRFQMLIDFGQPGIVYKETIKNTVEGVGHFEPLRHYAEVHLLLEPGEPGSGLVFSTRCSTDVLAKNWQRLVLTHLGERRHRGVLTGSEITDMKITLIAGRAHEKHTEGGDFRQATYRAVRQGLMMAENILLEPWYDFKMEIPRDSLGRALTDLQQMGARLSAPDFTGENGETALVEGSAPVSAMGDYSQEVKTYTRGEGRLTCTVRGYEPCHNTEEVMEARAYDPELDFANPAGSVFCSHGSGTLVPWNMVRDYMHVDTGWRPSLADGSYDLAEGAFKVSFVKSGMSGMSEAGGMSGNVNDFYNGSDAEEGYGRDTAGYRAGREKKDTRSFKEKARDYAAGEEELRAIFERTYGAVKPRVGEDAASGSESRRIRAGAGSGGTAGQEAYSSEQFYGRTKGGRGGQTGRDQKTYLLVDGYNIIYDWKDLRELGDQNLQSARDKLMEILSNFAGYSSEHVILVFDAYKVSGGQERVFRWHNIDVVFTKEAETADLYIEKAAHELTKKYAVKVATSDAVEQIIAYSAGAQRISARMLLEEILDTEKEIRQRTEEGRDSGKVVSRIEIPDLTEKPDSI